MLHALYISQEAGVHIHIQKAGLDGTSILRPHQTVVIAIISKQQNPI
jgi:hypothetical protein